MKRGSDVTWSIKGIGLSQKIIGTQYLRMCLRKLQIRKEEGWLRCITSRRKACCTVLRKSSYPDKKMKTATTIKTWASSSTRPGWPNLLVTWKRCLAGIRSSWWLITLPVTLNGCIASPHQWIRKTSWRDSCSSTHCRTKHCGWRR